MCKHLVCAFEREAANDPGMRCLLERPRCECPGCGRPAVGKCCVVLAPAAAGMAGMVSRRHCCRLHNTGRMFTAYNDELRQASIDMEIELHLHVA